MPIIYIRLKSSVILNTSIIITNSLSFSSFKFQKYIQIRNKYFIYFLKYELQIRQFHIKLQRIPLYNWALESTSHSLKHYINTNFVSKYTCLIHLIYLSHLFLYFPGNETVWTSDIAQCTHK